MAATLISRFEILETLGEGGMGRVYKARDPLLGRLVALKVLLPGTCQGERRERFLHEARSASSLNHPNIVTIYEVGQQDDTDFIAMEYVEGKQLRELIPPEGMPEERITAYAIQICDALERAHAAGILHRDLKPANILIRPDDVVKVLDFGLAKSILSASQTEATQSLLLNTPHTKVGTLMGTVGYMSPEQAEGLPVDPRSDVFSFGAVLYEMATGRRAFDGQTQVSILAKLLRDDPPSATGSVLHPVIWRCLRKPAHQRYAGFSEVRDALQQLRSPSSILRTAAAPESASIAVLPFLDLSPQKDQEYLCDGIAEEILNSLTRLRHVRVAARTSAFRFKQRRDDIREIGRQLNVSLVLDGSVRTAGNRLRVTTQLVDATVGHQIWSERYDRDLSDVFAVQDEIAASVVDALKGRCTLEPVSGISRKYTENLDAYSLYLRGRHAWNRWTPEGFEEAKRHFEAAIEKDPNYALAWAGLADTATIVASFGYGHPDEAYPVARSAARKALDIDANLGEAHVSMGAVQAFYEWDWKGAEESFYRAIERNPSHSTAYLGLAMACFAPRRMFPEAEKAIARARLLDPISLPVVQSAGTIAVLGRKLDHAAELEAVMTGMAPGFPNTNLVRADRMFAEGRNAEALEALEKFRTMVPANTASVAFCGVAEARMGKRTAAEARLVELEKASAHQFVQQFDFALVLAALGRMDEAYQRLDRAAAGHDGRLMYVGSDPKASEIRSDARFPQLLARMGLTARYPDNGSQI